MIYCDAINLEDNQQYPCLEEASYRMGIRCLNGCWGEGVFDYLCNTHLIIWQNKLVNCAICKIPVKKFPAQKLEAA